MKFSFENFPAQLIGLALGWAFTLYLQSRANHRTESLKRKDKLIDKIDQIPEWVEDKLTDDDVDLLGLEDSYSGLLSRIEIKIGQLNKHIGQNLISVSDIGRLRRIDLLPPIELRESDAEKAKGLRTEANADVRSICADLAEHIESACDNHFFKKRNNLLFKVLRNFAIIIIMLLLIV